MGNDDFEENLKQYGILTRKLLDVEKELDRLHESIRVEGVYTCTSSNKAVWSDIHEKITELTEVSKELHDNLHRILTMRETSKPL